jgi:hypothetical protein
MDVLHNVKNVKKNKKMKPNELRIGNLVNDNLGGILKIKGIKTESDLSHIRPIKLTDKWLIDFGFEKTEWDNNNSFRKMVGNNDYTIVFYSNCICEIGDVIVKEIQYVHQLQNLYFALTGNELQIAEAGKEN